jgi:hypothetical protein
MDTGEADAGSAHAKIIHKDMQITAVIDPVSKRWFGAVLFGSSPCRRRFFK